VDKARVSTLRELLAGTGWVERTRHFGRALQRAPHQAGGLLVIGTPKDDPWHFAAHLDDEARWSNQPALAPVLVRWSPPAGAPAHLAIGLERLEHVGKNETVFVVAPDSPSAPLLERIADARRVGATVFAMETGDADLEALADESLVVPAHAGTGLVVPEFDVVSHLVSAAAGETTTHGSDGRFGALRARLGRMLDAVGDRDDSA
jgi:hypothetical protein